MENQKPAIGRIVHYHTTESQQTEMGAFGNKQKLLPATIVAVLHGNLVNLKVHLDGNHADLWVTSSQLGDQPGNWNWPQRI